MEQFSIFAQYGALGILAAIAVYMVQNNIKESSLRDREHMEERKAFRDMLDAQHKETIEVTKDSINNQKQLLILNSEIKTLLKEGYCKKKH